ncbi:condensation domain-containing protein, partial [Dactylosporangium sp. NPDC049140]|uniref:condensation domain-containing protein n=1 Tax=Dactylosporangium sp. NPDC049140 TaxID=3155647 RepID=UPI0034049967
MYGPTETTVWSAVDQVTAGAPVTLGSPIAGTRWYVLDASLREVPAGVVGELYIGGAGVARGYLGRPELTAERFVADRDGARLYRTGDLARWRSDGRPEFLGRADFQVKVRGFRIELGEVEAAIRDQAGVSAAVVVADGSRLVAYVVGQCSVDGLRERLPDYMVPSVFVEMTSLPLNANGKVDRRALPAPDAPAAVGDYVAPRTPVEEAVAEVWGAVLGVERVGLFDDFFALGGHSLLATRVVSRIRSVFGVEVPVAALFDAPTVAGLAVAIDAAGPGIAAAAMVPVRRDEPLPLSFAQQRLWFLAQLDPGSAEYNLPSRIRLGGEVSVEALEAALTTLVARHEVLRTRLVANADGVPHQVIEPAAPFVLPVVDLSDADDPEGATRAWLAADGAAPFDLSAGPLFRATLVRVGPDEHVLALAMHHVVGDAWSAGILRRELDALYAGVELAPLPVQYADFAVWQRRWLTGEVLDRQVGYWRDRLDGVPVLELPADRLRPPQRSSAGAALRFVIPADVASGLRAVAREAGASMFMTVFAAFNVLLSRYAGQDDVVVGTPIANRNRAEIEGLIGFFVNTLVLRTDLSGDPTFAELVGRVRAGTLDAYAHQDVPFEHLVDELGVDRDRSRTPLFQVLFNYAAAAEGGEPVLRTGSVPMPVKFDLSVAVVEAGAGLVGEVQYSTVLFDEARMVRLIGHFQQLLAAVSADTGRRVSDLPMLTAAEVADLARWNDTVTVLPRGETVLDLIASQDPAAVAVRAGDTALT